MIWGWITTIAKFFCPTWWFLGFHADLTLCFVFSPVLLIPPLYRAGLDLDAIMSDEMYVYPIAMWFVNLICMIKLKYDRNGIICRLILLACSYQISHLFWENMPMVQCGADTLPVKPFTPPKDPKVVYVTHGYTQYDVWEFIDQLADIAYWRKDAYVLVPDVFTEEGTDVYIGSWGKDSEVLGMLDQQDDMDVIVLRPNATSLDGNNTRETMLYTSLGFKDAPWVSGSDMLPPLLANASPQIRSLLYSTGTVSPSRHLTLLNDQRAFWRCYSGIKIT